MADPQTADEPLTRIGDLHWMARANRHGWGLYGPTVRKLGRVPEAEELVAAGLARFRIERGKRYGYWITPQGRDALRGHHG